MAVLFGVLHSIKMPSERIQQHSPEHQIHPTTGTAISPGMELTLRKTEIQPQNFGHFSDSLLVSATIAGNQFGVAKVEPVLSSFVELADQCQRLPASSPSKFLITEGKLCLELSVRYLNPSLLSRNPTEQPLYAKFCYSHCLD